MRGQHALDCSFDVKVNIKEITNMLFELQHVNHSINGAFIQTDANIFPVVCLVMISDCRLEVVVLLNSQLQGCEERRGGRGR